MNFTKNIMIYIYWCEKHKDNRIETDHQVKRKCCYCKQEMILAESWGSVDTDAADEVIERAKNVKGKGKKIVTIQKKRR